MKTLKSITAEQLIIPVFVLIIVAFITLLALYPSKPEKVNRETTVGYRTGFYQGSTNAVSEYKLK